MRRAGRFASNIDVNKRAICSRIMQRRTRTPRPVRQTRQNRRAAMKETTTRRTAAALLIGLIAGLIEGLLLVALSGPAAMGTSSGSGWALHLALSALMGVTYVLLFSVSGGYAESVMSGMAYGVCPVAADVPHSDTARGRAACPLAGRSRRRCLSSVRRRPLPGGDHRPGVASGGPASRARDRYAAPARAAEISQRIVAWAAALQA